MTTTQTAQTGTDTAPQTVLVAGATGMLGSRIAFHLLGADGTSVRLLVRPGTTARPDKLAALQPLLDAGAQAVEADLTDPAALRHATTGVDVVVSALAGGRAVIVDGQIALARASKASGVRRFFPSDFALDLFTMTPGVVASYDVRREADEAIAGIGIESVHVLNGAFLDMFASPRGALDLDAGAGTATYWGTGREKFELTTVEDTARYTARAALDRDLPAGKFAVVGETLGFSDMVDEIERQSGRTFTRVSRGTVEELEQAAAAAREQDPASMDTLIAGYQVAMLTGRAALTDLQNDRYPDIEPTGYAELVAANWAAARP